MDLEGTPWHAIYTDNIVWYNVAGINARIIENFKEVSRNIVSREILLRLERHSTISNIMINNKSKFSRDMGNNQPKKKKNERKQEYQLHHLEFLSNA